MLRDRLLTALVLIPLVVAAVLWLPEPWLAGLFGLLVAVGAWEWSALSGLSSKRGRLLYAISFPPLMIIGYLADLPQGPIAILFGGISTAWVAVTLWLLSIRQPLPLDQGWSPGKLFGGYLALLPAWWAVLILRDHLPHGPQLLLFLFVLIWGADSGAYFAGKRWGRRKLAPLVSPGKTVEGASGALAATLLCALALGFWHPAIGIIGALLLCVPVTLLSIAGDLFESLLKRRAGLKDSGHILPGHGGVLDRIDSLTAAAPAFVFGLLLLGAGL